MLIFSLSLSAFYMPKAVARAVGSIVHESATRLGNQGAHLEHA